jgi:hypothetical protein
MSMAVSAALSSFPTKSNFRRAKEKLLRILARGEIGDHLASGAVDHLDRVIVAHTDEQEPPVTRQGNAAWSGPDLPYGQGFIVAPSITLTLSPRSFET